jgi:two-component system sensor histidine kinase QseC
MTSIRAHLTRDLVVGAAALAAIGGGTIYALMHAALLHQFDRELLAKATAVTMATEQEGDRTTIDDTDRLMRGFGEREPTDFFEIWSASGRVIGRSESLGSADLPARPASASPDYSDLRLPTGAPGRAVNLTFRPHGSREHEGTTDDASRVVTLTVASDRRDLSSTLTVLALILAASGAGLVVLTTVLVPRALGRALAPLERLGQQAGGITAQSLTSRFAADGPSELTPITAALNRLLDRLESSFERERRFSGDAAHELRTPIAELRASAELAIKWPETREPRTDHDHLSIAVRMETIVTRLLALLRTEHGRVAVSPEPTWITDLLTTVWRPLSDGALAKRLVIRWQAHGDGLVTTDAEFLRTVVRNLLENAVEYTPAGGRIEILTTAGPEQFHVRISNTTHDLAKADLSHLFDRFWRKDEARASGEHCGLGLPLARACAEAIRCDLRASLDGDLLTMTLIGPTQLIRSDPQTTDVD